MKDRKMSFYNRIVKRMLDIICSLAAIVCLSVLYLPICAIIKCTSEGPVFFRQKRIGKNKKYFNILKFRTMRIDTPKDCPTHLLKNPEQYITKVGAFLRKTSLDELPQIFNIFKGDMSVIGPRPALWNQDDLISENDLLFTRYNGSLEYVGVCACVPQLQEKYAYPDKIIKCTPKLKNSYHSRFLQYSMNQGEARKYIRSKIKTTSGQKGIAGSDIKKF